VKKEGTGSCAGLVLAVPGLCRLVWFYFAKIFVVFFQMAPCTKTKEQVKGISIF